MNDHQPTNAELVNAIRAYLDHAESDSWYEIYWLQGTLDQVAKSGDFQALITTLDHRRSRRPV